MKKLLSLLLAAAMILTLCACTSAPAETTTTPAETTSAPAAGVPFTAAYFQSKGDVITDLVEDLAAEQKARTTYDNILRLVDDPDIREPIKFLRAREVVHFQRFGDALRITQDHLDSKNFYAHNPSFDKCGRKMPRKNG